MVRVTLIVEGGGDSDSLRRKAREGFGRFVENAGLRGSMPGIVAAGGRDNAYKKFVAAHEDLESGEAAMLLVDAEGPVTAPTAWEHLRNRDKEWKRPNGASDDQCHLMTQVMESWFLADPEALQEYFGQGFRVKALRGDRNNVEETRKDDVMDSLAAATKDARKGTYVTRTKGKHSFKMLAKLDPALVQKASPHAKRFVDALKKLCAT